MYTTTWGIKAWFSHVLKGEILKYVELTKGEVALVDDEDYNIVSERKWHAKKSILIDDLVYAYTKIGGKLVSMHSYIMDTPPEGMEIDHINHNGLDNRRSNLRFITRGGNLHNRRF